uniref:OB_NTP_bind domain-containing protein n=1 Tax=Macrostomum lignano TaxID=282301 RepID=A0A1I8IT68_9PLAT
SSILHFADKQVAYNLIKAIGSSRGGGSRGIGLEGLGIEGAAVGASNRGGGLRQQVRGLPLPPPEDRHTFGKRTRPPTPHRLPRSGGADATASTMLSNGLRNNYASVRLRAQSARTSADYVHLGSGFTNACPPYRSNFVVHPDWVSEVTAPAPLPRPTRRAVNQK